MAEEINGILIKELPEASQSQLTDPTDIIVEDATTTRRSKLSTLANWLKSKLGIGTAANLTTTSKEIVGAVNELNTKIKYETFRLSGTENNAANTWNYIADAGYRAPEGYKIVSVCGGGTAWPYASVNPVVMTSGAIFVWYYKGTVNAQDGNLNKIALYITLEKI